MVKISNLIKNEENPIISANNSILGAIPISSKLSLQDSQKFLDPSTTSKGASGTGTLTADPIFNSVTVETNVLIKHNTTLRSQLNVSGLSVFSDETTFKNNIKCGIIKSISDMHTSINEPSEQLNLEAHVINIGLPSSIVNIYGTTTSIITTDLLVRDKLVSLNLGITDTNPYDIGNNSGIEIMGTGGSGFIITNEDATRFYIKAPQGDTNYLPELDLLNNLSISGTGIFYEGITSLSFLSVSGITVFNDNATFNSNLSIMKNTVIDGSLYLKGETILNTDTTVNSSFAVGENVYIQGRLYVTDKTTLTGETFMDSLLSVIGPITCSSALYINGSTLLNDSLLVANGTTIGSTLSVAGNTILNNPITGVSTLFIGGSTLLNDSLSVANNTTIGSTLSVAGELTAYDSFFYTGSTVGTTSEILYIDIANGLITRGSVPAFTNLLSSNNVWTGTNRFDKVGINADVGATEHLRVSGNATFTGSEFIFGEPHKGTTIYLGGGGTGDNGYDHSVIETRKWGNEDQTELLLFKGNDSAENPAHGPDRIRLKAGEIRFDTYPGSSVNRQSEETKMKISANGVDIFNNLIVRNFGETVYSFQSYIASDAWTINEFFFVQRNGSVGYRGIINEAGQIPITISGDPDFSQIRDVWFITSSGNATFSNVLCNTVNINEVTTNELNTNNQTIQNKLIVENNSNGDSMNIFRNRTLFSNDYLFFNEVGTLGFNPNSWTIDAQGNATFSNILSNSLTSGTTGLILSVPNNSGIISFIAGAGSVPDANQGLLMTVGGGNRLAVFKDVNNATNEYLTYNYAGNLSITRPQANNEKSWTLTREGDFNGRQVNLNISGQSGTNYYANIKANGFDFNDINSYSSPLIELGAGSYRHHLRLGASDRNLLIIDCKGNTNQYGSFYIKVGTFGSTADTRNGFSCQANGDTILYNRNNFQYVRMSYDRDTDVIQFVYNDAQGLPFGLYWYLSKNGNNGISCDKRVKEHIRELDADKSFRFIKKLKPSVFKWKNGSEDIVNFIAQEVLEACETDGQINIVNHGKEYLQYKADHNGEEPPMKDVIETDEDGEEVLDIYGKPKIKQRGIMLGVGTQSFIPEIVKALQVMIVDNENLKADNGMLKARLDTLENEYPSDTRIKENILNIDDTSALNKLRLLQPKTYNYVDKVTRGNDNVFGFISQEVKQVLPSAVNIITNIIPNFMTRCKISLTDISNVAIIETEKDLLWNPLHDTSGNPYIDASGNACSDALGNKIFKIKLYEPSNNVIIMNTINIIDKTRFLIDLTGTKLLNENVNTLEYENGYFLHGQEVDDFHTLDKNAIFTVATAALQEVDKQQQAHKVHISSLENVVNVLKEENTNMKTELDVLKQQVALLLSSS